MQPGTIITVVAYDHEKQPFEFCGKVSALEGDRLILSDVFNNALEQQNSPFNPVESEFTDTDIFKDFVVNQFASYRQLGLTIQDASEKIEQDIKFLDEKI